MKYATFAGVDAIYSNVIFYLLRSVMKPAMTLCRQAANSPNSRTKREPAMSDTATRSVKYQRQEDMQAMRLYGSEHPNILAAQEKLAWAVLALFDVWCVEMRAVRAFTDDELEQIFLTAMAVASQHPDISQFVTQGLPLDAAIDAAALGKTVEEIIDYLHT